MKNYKLLISFLILFLIFLYTDSPVLATPYTGNITYTYTVQDSQLETSSLKVRDGMWLILEHIMPMITY
jgi:hypothetical protein